jgi:succinate dehydrogenase / fumarate reductase, cytochrome b subunit
MANKRPVNLNLISFKFPLTALVSIGHRISGVIMFLLLPLSLYTLSHFVMVKSQSVTCGCVLDSHLFFSLLIWVFMVATIFHAIAGVRHLLMDLGIGESFEAANRSAALVIFLLLLTMIVTGVWLWA